MQTVAAVYRLRLRAAAPALPEPPTISWSATSPAAIDRRYSYNRAMERVPKDTGERFERLVDIMETLRGPDGCPWDKQQDFNSLKPMLVEEVYEVLEAIENNDFDGLSEELGDLLLHVVFHAYLGKEAGQFDINTVIEKIY